MNFLQPDYRHKHQDSDCNLCSASDGTTYSMCQDARSLSCERLGCNIQLLVKRTRLQESIKSDYLPLPEVHIVTVGSGDTFMKSGIHRNATAEQHNLIAFEMEASGICDIFPALVIKGVCDYSDSHKKKKGWQRYATITAAACTKAFLEKWAS
ncbi:uncharacterized protein BDV17DRAFT_256672 [Aspergillus undulatus]|uniref:uncharacterized protein n=1 Tax=Aspergillus undulatus TaxID=1810928 RepID=UPI003CCD4925